MFGALIRPLARRGVRRAVLAVAVVVAVGVAWFCRGSLVHRATAQPAARQVAAERPPASQASGSDYARRVVAYIHHNQAISRQDLGEFLIDRHGADKLPLLINKKIVDMACQKHGIVVTAAEVEAAVGQELKDLAMNRATFLKTVLTRYKKNLYEFKEDIVRPRLQLTRLVQSNLTVSEEDLRKAFDSLYGEKVECRIILWPRGEEKKAQEEYGGLRDSETAFAERAKHQARSDLASTGGKINPVCRYSMDPEVEKEVFALQPGRVSTLRVTPDGTVMFKCDRRIPADTTVNFDAVREKLIKEILDRKVVLEMGKAFQLLKGQARPKLLLKKIERPVAGPAPSPAEVVATVHGDVRITREDLGEFLIARYGGDKLEYLVNRRILDRACKQKNLTVGEDEVDRALEADLTLISGTGAKIDPRGFEKSLLTKWGKTLFEWREDVIKTRLMLTKLCQGRVKWTEEDLRKGFEAYHGERLECRMILWPTDQKKFANKEYARIRDSEEEFDRKARSQTSPTLAQVAGKLPTFGRHCLGDETLEREAFHLQPGEVSAMIGTPQGVVVLKCDKRIPPDKTVTLEQERDRLIKETMEKKLQIEMQVVFKELHQLAMPNLLLKGTGQPEDLKAETDKLMADLPPLYPRKK